MAGVVIRMILSRIIRRFLLYLQHSFYSANSVKDAALRNLFFDHMKCVRIGINFSERSLGAEAQRNISKRSPVGDGGEEVEQSNLFHLLGYSTS